MNVCHITSVHPISDTRIFYKECSSLAANGFKVTLIVCGDVSFEEIRNGIKCISLCIPVRNRIERFIKRPKAIFRRAIQVDADVYHFHDPELMYVGFRLKKKNKIVICDIHEDYPRNILTKEWIPVIFRNIVSKLIAIYENYAVKHYDAIISVTPQIINRFNRVNKNSFLITNYPIVNIQPSQAADCKDKDTFCYIGTITPVRNLHIILDALESMPYAKLILAGEYDPYIDRLAKMKGWKNVEYFGYVSPQKASVLYAKSIFGIVIEDYHAVNYYMEGSLGITKLFEYMLAGLPVICTDFSLHKRIIDEYDCGITVTPRDVKGIINAIEYLLKNPNEALRMGNNGRKAVIQKYNWRSQEKILLEIYRNLNFNLSDVSNKEYTN